MSDRELTPIIEKMLTETGVKPTKELAEALDAYNAATPNVVEQIDAHDAAMTVKPADVPELIADIARRRSLTTQAVLTSQAYADVRAALDRRVVMQFASTAGDVFVAYQKLFDALVPTFVDAVHKLPETLTLEVASQRGTEALAAWGICTETVKQLDEYAHRRDTLVTYLGKIPNQFDQAAAFCEIPDASLVDQVLYAEKTSPFGHWVSLVRLGVKLRWGNFGAGDDLRNRVQIEHGAAQAQAAEQAKGDGLREMRMFDRMANTVYESAE